MKIGSIFAVDKSKKLYSVAYEDQPNEFQRLLNLWIQDIEFLAQFFETHESDLLSGFFGNMSMEQAIELTRREAVKLRDQFYRILNSSDAGAENLQQIFKPLSNTDYQLKPLAKEKSKRGWLRIYAIRISADVYVVSGGAIKLTATMNTRPHLLLELQKLEATRQFLKENGLIDESNFDFVEFEI
ncbi:hypothetical protein [Emticicia sp. TH156]|uniref:hypothetical protein n=1 Tax=Emticicia sp. TH156 TaxID=2067454 RepID=UPI000C78D666|nr:hypothetical protein [Emticicia sp. TH156]PLK44467.1 hypothetical protein C0V77_11830 [Emticicia sp. TH156]